MELNLTNGVLLAVAALGAGAYAWSRFGTVKPAQAAELAKQPGTFILDVRTPEEYSHGRLEKSVLIPVQQLAGRLGDLPADKNTPILVYCAMGGRSAVAASMLKGKGFKRVHNLAGGINAWQTAGLPVVK